MDALVRSGHDYPTQQGQKNVFVRIASNAKTGGGQPRVSFTLAFSPSPPVSGELPAAKGEW